MNISYYLDSIRRMRLKQVYVRVFNKYIAKLYYRLFGKNRIPLDPPVVPNDFFTFVHPMNELADVKQENQRNIQVILKNADEALNGRIQVHYRTFHEDVIREDDWNRHHHEDPEILYQTNRFRLYGIDLAKAYLYSGERKYLTKLISYIDSWIANCPKSKSVPWHSMNTSLRIYSWIWIYYLIGKDLPDDFKDRFLGSLLVQIQHVYRYPEYEIWNNHLIYNGFAMWLGGNIFPAHFMAGKWKRKGEKILEDECLNEFSRDGFNLEYCPSYHFMCTRLYLEYLLLGGDSKTIREYTERMADAGLQLLKPDGTVPPLADHFLSFYEVNNELDAQVVAILAAHIFDREDLLAWIPSLEEWPESVYWYLDKEEIDRLRGIEPSGNEILLTENQSYLVFRNSMDPDAFYVNLDIGDFGLSYCPGHAHADINSFELSAYGTHMIVDPGTYSYEETKRSKELKETRFHNTVQIDGLDQSIHWRYMRWVNLPKVTREWIERSPETGWFRIKGSHNGYESRTGLTHERIFGINTNDNYMILEDHIRGLGEHDLETHFHIPDGAIEQPLENCVLVKYSDKKALLIAFNFGSEQEVHVESIKIYPHYGQEVDAQRLTIRSSCSGGGVNNSIVLLPLPKFSPDTLIAKDGNIQIHDGKRLRTIDLSQDDLKSIVV